MKILWFNHRDITHPQAGGAEVYLHEIGKRLAKYGDKVTIFCERYPGASPKDRIDGLDVVRCGGKYLIHLKALIAHTEKFDVLVDDMAHGVPFYTPLFGKGLPVCGMMMHWHDQVIMRELRFPQNLVAKACARTIPFFYRDVQWITISQATRNEMLTRGFSRSKIVVVQPGIDTDIFNPREKSETPLIVCVSRLRRYKNIDHLILAFNEVLRRLPECRLVVLGTGEQAADLKKLVKRLRIEDRISFAEVICLQGKNLNFKIQLLSKAWLAVIPSSYEGFSLAALEALACGTPIITTNISSLEELVNASGAGMTYECGKIDQLASSIVAILKNRERRTKMSLMARSFALRFNWAESAERTRQTFQAMFETYPRPERKQHSPP